MDEKELAKRLNEIHDKHRAALEAHTMRLGKEDNARKWLKEKAKWRARRIGRRIE